MVKTESQLKAQAKYQLTQAYKDAQKKYIINNKDKIKERAKKYRESNREIFNKANKKYYHKNIELSREYKRNYHNKNRENINIKQRMYYKNNFSLLKLYYITKEDYKIMLQKQNNKCKICKKDFEEVKINIDHCHITNKVRGLLCKQCNIGLGHFKDNINYLNNAINYLESK